MNPKSFLRPGQLERNSFLWSQARLVIAAIALFAGGVPPILLLISSSSVLGPLKIAWLISGVASVYLGYRWFTGGQRVFGGKDRHDTIAFLVSVVSGLNLGWTGLSGNNVGMSISSNQILFVIVGALYLWAAYHLQRRWNIHGHKLF